jgi:hypothetical protein
MVISGALRTVAAEAFNIELFLLPVKQLLSLPLTIVKGLDTLMSPR